MRQLRTLLLIAAASLVSGNAPAIEPGDLAISGYLGGGFHAIYVLDRATLTTDRIKTVLGTPADLAFDLDDQVVVLGNYLLRVDPVTEISTSIVASLVGSPQTLAVEDDGNLLVGRWEGSPPEPGILRIDPVSGAASSATAFTVNGVIGIVPNRDGSFYAALNYGGVQHFAADGSQIEGGLPAWAASDLAPHPDGTMIYVNVGADSIWRFDPIRKTVTELTPGVFDFLTDTLAVDDDGQVYVRGILAGEVDHALFSVDPDTAAVTVVADTLPASGASAIAVLRSHPCSDGDDDDGDGLIDLADPGCRDAHDPSEEFDCEDGLDSDRDGLVDHPADPGCSGPTDPDERGAAAACDDGLDGDGDGWADYPGDPGCTGPTDASENDPALVCDDGIDNDGDGLTDFPFDAGCVVPEDASENSTSLCDDGIDNDGDGLIDFPADPGCIDETGSENPGCNDGVDNDNDGDVDFDGGPNGRPVDAGCSATHDTSEGGACLLACGSGVTFDPGDYWTLATGTVGGPALVHVNGADTQQTIVQRVVMSDLTIDAQGRVVMAGNFIGQSGGGPFTAVLRRTATVTFWEQLATDFPGLPVAVDLEHDGTILVGVLNDPGSSEASLFRIDPVAGGATPVGGTPPERVRGVLVAPSGEIWVSSEVAGLQRLAADGVILETVAVTPGGAAQLALGTNGELFFQDDVSDTVRRYDPETGTFSDLAPGRFDSVEAIEASGDEILVVGTRPGETELRIHVLDPLSTQVTDETSGGAIVDPVAVGAVRAPRCSDGVDNDGDGLADFPDDPGCADAADPSERSNQLCDNGIDDDGDGLIDFPADPGCKSVDWLENPACDNGIDDDGDGGIDWQGGPGGEPADLQCVARPWQGVENPSSCGLGMELLLPLWILAGLRVRGSRAAQAPVRRGGRVA